MDFFGAQEAARARSRRLTVLFLAAVAAIIGTVYVAVQITMLGYVRPGGAFFQPVLFGWVAGATLLLVGSGSLYRIGQLRRGGPAVAAMMGGRRVPPDSVDPDERRLLNVVEEMAVASGTPVPAVYVLADEAGMNAFAAGYSIHDAAVAVTAGTLRGLSRDELQGVIAHEFSHILNGDMRMNIRLIGLLHGILLLAVVGRGLLRGSSRGSSSRKGNQAALLGAALVLVGYIGVFFGKLIRAAISREREYLADAAAVQFTRNPEGIAGALKKIGIHSAGSRVYDHHAEEVSHLFFAHALRSHWLGFLSTHPPLEERIRRVDPRWDGWLISPGALEMAGGGASGLLSSIGSPTGEHLQHAFDVLAALPSGLREAAREPEGARALVFALLLGSSEDAAGPGPDEVAAVHEAAGPALIGRIDALTRLVREAGAEVRLPLLDLALPTLLALAPGEARELHAAVLRAVRADGDVRMFEYTLVHVLWRHLAARPPAVPYGRTIHSFKPIRAEIEVVLSGLAHAGADDEVRARAAFASATARLPAAAGELHLLGKPAIGLPEVDAALARIGTTSFGVRRRLLDACVHCVTHDRQVGAREAELLRAVAEALDCPMPLPSGSAQPARRSPSMDGSAIQTVLPTT